MISAEALSTLTELDIADLRPVSGGGNSRVFKVVMADGTVCVAKFYPPVDDLGRDRLATEWRAISFLAAHGITDAPVAVSRHDAHRLALYTWIDGQPVGDPSLADIDQALAFIAELAALGRDADADGLPAASEACFDATDILRQIDRRLVLYRAVPELRDVLADVETTLAILRPSAADWTVPLARAHRILSPSDFGFHNALRRRDGTLGFVDFEYFGWDDPVKLIADMLWHPAMCLVPPVRRRLVDGANRIFANDPDFARRLRALYPLYGLRWCAIMLAEFLPERWAQRVAAGQTAERASVLDAQRAKVRYYLARIATEDDMLEHDGRHAA